MEKESVTRRHRACHPIVRGLDQRDACRVGVGLTIDRHMVQPAKSVATLQHLQAPVVERAGVHCH